MTPFCIGMHGMESLVIQCGKSLFLELTGKVNCWTTVMSMKMVQSMETVWRDRIGQHTRKSKEETVEQKRRTLRQYTEKAGEWKSVFKML